MFSGETDFYLYQFLFSFFKYFFSNFPLSYLYNILIIYSSSNYPPLNFLSSTISNFSYLLTSIFNLPSNSATTSFVFSKSSSLLYNIFYYKPLLLYQVLHYSFHFFLGFSPLLTLWILLSLLVLLLLLFVPLSVLYITLSN